MAQFLENITENKVSLFSPTYIWNLYHSQNNSARYYHKYM